ncbi:structural protein [Cellulophaga phage phi48:2]|uniref:structural protein n=1 Tax=Cellulophaga phage phi48:2 TaxID=1327968 RepID=UPI0003519B9A|nr:structural protein [Cellulophaga phage phi48:2]AGO47276.1 structural protein [Cellulophaga phage phi48:2]
MSDKEEKKLVKIIVDYMDEFEEPFKSENIFYCSYENFVIYSNHLLESQRHSSFVLVVLKNETKLLRVVKFHVEELNLSPLFISLPTVENEVERRFKQINMMRQTLSAFGGCSDNSKSMAIEKNHCIFLLSEYIINYVSNNSAKIDFKASSRIDLKAANKYSISYFNGHLTFSMNGNNYVNVRIDNDYVFREYLFNFFNSHYAEIGN